MVLQAQRPVHDRRSGAFAHPMGYQPSLDGIRAIAVLAVLLYHADLRWIPGGFLGVDVFFVVSGYLITSLLIEERRGSMSTDLRQFWLRRARRLLPALFAMLIVTCCYAAAFVPDALYRLRTDVVAAADFFDRAFGVGAESQRELHRRAVDALREELLEADDRELES